MLTNVASTSMDAHRAIKNHTFVNQYQQIESILKCYPKGTTRKHISFITNHNPIYHDMEPGTVSARVNEMVACGRLIEDGTAVIAGISHVRSKVVRLP